MDTKLNSTAQGLRAFLCHASEDNDLARRIAADLLAAGIDTFLDEWEIAAGQSLRRKIDEGIASCTHFVVLLTPNSLLKPWVNAEIDAAFIQKVEGNSVLIPLRHGLEVKHLPPLLAALLSPELRNYETDIKRLVDDIRGISRKPAVQPITQPIPSAWGARFRLSPLATSIAELFAKTSKNGRPHDPQLDVRDMLEATGSSDEDLLDAISELTDLGWVKPHRVIGAPPFGYRTVTPTAGLFLRIDRHVMGWKTEEDARRVATEIVNSERGGIQSHEILARLDWTPRRLNPALSYLVGQRLVMASQNLNPTFVTSYVAKNERTRRFVRDNS